MAFTIGELARLAGISVRTLHHYDEVGLVRPSARTAAGYRLYDDADVRRLQLVLVHRELGLSLDDIARLLAAAVDGTAVLAQLREHRARLIDKRTRLDAMVTAVDAALHLAETEQVMSGEQVRSMFDGFDSEAYADEAAERWGETPEHAETARRTKRYGKAEWAAIRREGDAVYARFAELMNDGAAPDDPRVAAAVTAHREHIDRWFYPCSPAIQRGLAQLYVDDPRFTANIDRVAPGLAAYLHASIIGQPDAPASP